MSVINEREDPIKLLPEAELVKMNTKFNGRMGVQESPIPMAALYNRKLNRLRKTEDTQKVIKSPVTIYFDELRHGSPNAETKKLRLLVEGEADIAVDLS